MKSAKRQDDAKQILKVLATVGSGTRKARTLSLNDENFVQLEKICGDKVKVSHLIDHLIARFLDEHKQSNEP